MKWICERRKSQEGEEEDEEVVEVEVEGLEQAEGGR